MVHFPVTTALGALGRYISSSEAKNYQPALVARALRDHDAFAAAHALAGVPAI